MPFTRLEIPEVILIVPKVFGDERGYFFEAFKDSGFKEQGITGPIVQESQSMSQAKHTLRGLHYQTDPHAQGKILRVLRGSVFDVALDIRKGSPTYGKWVGQKLTASGKEQIWIPKGFAHGFMTLEDDCEIAYKITGSEYHPENESGIAWDDPAINISWPSNEPILSAKDSDRPTLEKAINNFVYKKG